MTNKPCEVKDCTGSYEVKTLFYVNRNKRGTADYEIPVEEYSKIIDKKGIHAVVSENCNVCNDDLHDRIIAFLNNGITL